MFLPLLIKFDKQSPVINRKSFVIPFWVDMGEETKDDDVLKVVTKWLGRPFMQEWFKDCKVVWIETIGEVELLMEDFV